MPERINVSLADLRQIRARIDARAPASSDWALIGALVSNFLHREEDKIERMLARLAEKAAEAMRPGPGASDDGKTIDIADPADTSDSGKSNPIREGEPQPATTPKPTSKPKPPGHGRNAPSAYTQARDFQHALAKGVIGSPCSCGCGPMTRHREQVLIRVIGQPMFGAQRHHFEQARCKACGRVVKAVVPSEISEGLGKSVTYHWSACAMLIVLHYFSGLPFKRLENLHKSWGIPFADANQWEVARGAMKLLAPLFEALVKYAIQNVVNLRMDDTGSIILSLKREIANEIAVAKSLGLPKEGIRTGINASGFYIETADAIVLLFYTGRHHAGEVLHELLKHREVDALPVLKVTDGASKNFDSGTDGLVEGVCNAHAFLKFRNIKADFPQEYALVGEAYDKVFENEENTRAQKMSADERLTYHQRHSRPCMERIRNLCAEKLQNRLVEPRSPLWEAVTFFINQWPRLTKFLEVAGMPLDTNLIEQGLIIPVRYLSASFNYKTQNGANTGDQAMSLVATAKANNTEPVAWLTHCLKNHEDLAKNPEKYFPWACRDQLAPRQIKPFQAETPIH